MVRIGSLGLLVAILGSAGASTTTTTLTRTITRTVTFTYTLNQTQIDATKWDSSASSSGSSGASLAPLKSSSSASLDSASSLDSFSSSADSQQSGSSGSFLRMWQWLVLLTCLCCCCLAILGSIAALTKKKPKKKKSKGPPPADVPTQELQEETVPLASVAVDVDGDGVADAIYTGVDLNNDGIPDAMQMPMAPLLPTYSTQVPMAAPSYSLQGNPYGYAPAMPATTAYAQPQTYAYGGMPQTPSYATAPYGGSAYMQAAPQMGYTTGGVV